jgi:hypothetical protein
MFFVSQRALRYNNLEAVFGRMLTGEAQPNEALTRRAEDLRRNVGDAGWKQTKILIANDESSDEGSGYFCNIKMRLQCRKACRGLTGKKRGSTLV